MECKTICPPGNEIGKISCHINYKKVINFVKYVAIILRSKQLIKLESENNLKPADPCMKVNRPKDSTS